MPLRPKIQQRFERLEHKTRELFSHLRDIPSDELSRHPQPKYWSALEALNHIYLGEKLSVQYVKFKLTKAETIPLRRPDAWFRTLILKWILYSPIKFKSPPQINMRNDQPALGLSDLQAEWKSLRIELRGILEEHEQHYRRRLPYKQPYAGRMTFNQMLIFFEDHLAHHTRQIQRILRAVRK